MRWFAIDVGVVRFRLGPWWVSVKDTERALVLFSERSGAIPTWRCGRLLVSARRMQ